MPGEYYIDRNNSKIYFWPTATDYSQNDFIVSVANNVLTLSGVEYFTLQGITIEASRKDVSLLLLLLLYLKLTFSVLGHRWNQLAKRKIAFEFRSRNFANRWFLGNVFWIDGTQLGHACNELEWS